MERSKGWKLIPNTSYSYRISNPIGNGAYGTVYLGLDKKTEDHVAVKTVLKDFINRLNKTTQLERELAFFSRKDIRHDNIVNVLGVYEDERFYYLITEYCEGGNLYKYLTTKREISESEAIDIMTDILNGYSYLRSLGYIHRDLKTENILRKNGRYKICDFGSIRSSLQGLLMSAAPGTLAYMSPEMLKGTEKYDYKTDIWSLGVIFYELLLSKLPFQNKNPMCLLDEMQTFQSLDNKIEVLFSIDKKISQETKDLIIKMLWYNQSDRITLEDISNSALFVTEDSNEVSVIRRRQSVGCGSTYSETVEKFKKVKTIEDLDKIISSTTTTVMNASNQSIIIPSQIKQPIKQPILPKNHVVNHKIHIYPMQESYINVSNVQSELIVSKPKIKLLGIEDKKQQVTIIQADEKTEDDLAKLSQAIHLRNQGLNLLREKISFEVNSIEYIKKMIDDIRKFAAMNKLELIKFYQLTFPLAKIACMKYATIIRPIFEKKQNVTDISQELWNAIIDNKEFMNIVRTARNTVYEQQTLYISFLGALKDNLDKNPLKKPLSVTDEKFMDILNYNFTDKDKVLGVLEDILKETIEEYQRKNEKNEFCDTFLNSMENFLDILKIGKQVDILVLNKISLK